MRASLRASGHACNVDVDIDLNFMSTKGILKITFNKEDMVNLVTQCEKNKIAPT